MTATALATTLIAKIRKYWPDPAVLAAITDPSQIDNAPEPWLATSQKWIIGGLEVVAMKRKKEHVAPFERTPDREALMSDYVAALREYILTEPTLIERAIAVLDHQSDTQLTKAIADVHALTALQRKQLIQLVEADDQAEQRAAARAARDARQAALQSELETRRAKLEPKD